MTFDLGVFENHSIGESVIKLNQVMTLFKSFPGLWEMSMELWVDGEKKGARKWLKRRGQ